MESPRLMGHPWWLGAGHPEQGKVQNRLPPHSLAPASDSPSQEHRSEGGAGSSQLNQKPLSAPS